MTDEPERAGHDTVAVTGANGFVGSAVMTSLANQGRRVIALSRRRPANLPATADWRALDDLSSPTLNPNLSGITAVVHCAARVHVMQDHAADPLAEFRRANCEGTLALAQSAAAQGVRRFVFVSSIKVNGEGSRAGRPFRPDDAAAPSDPYALSKLEAEQGLWGIARETGLAVAIVRPVLVYGAGVKANFAALARLAVSGVPLPFADTRNRRSLIYVENLADLLAKLATGELPSGHVMLASDGEAVSTGDLVRRLARAQGRSARLFPVPSNLIVALARIIGRETMAKRVFGSLETDSDHLAKLGWRPPFSLDAGLKRSFGASV